MTSEVLEISADCCHKIAARTMRNVSTVVHRSGRNRSLALACLVLLAVTTVAFWGGPNDLIAQGDQFPVTLLNPGKRLPKALALWNTTWSGGGELHYDAGLVLLSIVAWLPRTLGVSPALLQRVEFALIISGILLSAYSLPYELRITSLVVPRLLGSIGYTFSLALTSHVVDLLTYLVFLLVTGVPVVYAQALRSTGLRFARNAVLVGMFMLLFAFVFLNPPQTVVAGVQIIAICFLITVRHFGRDVPISKIIWVMIVTALINIWWLVPAYVTTFDASLQMVAPTDVVAWSWTQTQSSILNVWQSTPLWGWPHREYYPWAVYFDSTIVQVLLLWPLFVVLLAALLGRKHVSLSADALWLWIIVTLVAIFLVKGLHPPLGDANLWLYRHVPGFFLFREPENKFSEPLDFAVAMLLVSVLCRLRHRRAYGRLVWPGAAWIVALALGVLALPTVTGAVTAGATERIAPLRVTIPTYWWDAAAFVNTLPGEAGIAVLPNDDFYAMPYTWGLYVADQLPQELFNRPVFYLYDTPQGYVTAAIRLERLEERLTSDLHAGRTDDLAAALGSQGVRYVLLRRDIDASPTFPGRHIVPPAVLADQLGRTPGLTVIRTFGQLDLYEIAPSLVRDPLYIVSSVRTQTHDPSDVASVLETTKRNIVTVSSPVPPCSPTPSGAATSPSLEILQRGLDSYSVRVTIYQAPALLVLNQSYHPDWSARLDGVKSPNSTDCTGATLPHVVAAGFANAWWLTRPGTNIVRISFGKQRVFGVAEAISGATIAAAGFILLAPAVRYWRNSLSRK
ncbi:MAG: hypothetical protein ACR2PL_13100 [Dehalococcoidia bacterium]